MKLSENITWTDVFTLVLILVTVGFYIYNILRDNRKANDILQAKNYYFLSLMMQMHKKKLSSSFSKFVEKLSEEGKENFYLRLYTVVESRSIKNIAVDDLLKYYSEPVKHQNDTDFKQVQRSWFYCFEYCQQWESSQEDAIQEQNDIDERGKLFYDDFFDKYEKIESEMQRLSFEDFVVRELYNSFFELREKHKSTIEKDEKLPSMFAILEDYYTPFSDIMSSIFFSKFEIIIQLIVDSQKIYGRYWAFIKEKIQHFTREIDNQRRAELEFDKSLSILINYSIQHSVGEFKDMYKTLAKQMDVKE